MSHTRRIAIGVVTAAAFLAAGATSALAAPAAPAAAAAQARAVAAAAAPVQSQAYQTSLGPYEFESQCLRAGNQGIENGEWSDYECTGSYGAWYIRPSG